MVRNRDRDTPSRHRAQQRVGMIGTRSAISIRARGHWPHSEAVYMTAPDASAAPKKALAERGPSIHDDAGFKAISLQDQIDLQDLVEGHGGVIDAAARRLAIAAHGIEAIADGADRQP